MKITCPRRMTEFGPWERKEKLDKFKQNRCSFCGSVAPDKFMERVKAGEEVGSTDKSYKFYIGDHEKFYTKHLSEEQAWEFWTLWNENKINFGQFPPYVPIYLPGVRERLDATAQG